MDWIKDPAEHNVDVVLEWAWKHLDEAQRLLDMEEVGKGRKTLITGLEEIIGPAEVETPPASSFTVTGAATVSTSTGANVTYVPPNTPATFGSMAVSHPAAVIRLEPSSDFVPLQKGDQGPAVIALQNRLPGVSATGRFGAGTVAAVRRVQADNGLPVTGAVDEATSKAIG